MVAPVTFLLVDGENIDGVLGQILGHRPDPADRPRWERVAQGIERWGNAPVRSFFFINGSSGTIPGPFIQALRAVGYTPVLVAGQGKVVDQAIVVTLAEIEYRQGPVALASHDADFALALERLASQGRRVGLACFTEYASGQLTSIEGLDVLDLEDGLHAFRDGVQLPRIRIIPIERFDPVSLLGDAGLKED